MGDIPVIPTPPDFPPTTYADQTQPPPVITVDTAELERPTQDFAFPQSTLDQLYRWSYWFNKDHLAPAATAHQHAGKAVGKAIDGVTAGQVFVGTLNATVAAIAGTVLSGLDAIRKTLDPAFGILAVSVLSELLGTDFSAEDLPTGTDVSDHIARAQDIGAKLTTQLETEFISGTSVTPAGGRDAANKFTGFAINFSVANGILAVIGAMVPELHLDEIREVGEGVAQNIGLGRLVRGALRPLVQVLVTQPYTWYLNQKYHATQFKEGDLVNTFAGTAMSHDTIFNAMDLLGYSTDKINELITLHQKRLTLREIDTAKRYTYLSGDALTKQLNRLGYAPADGTLALQAVEASSADAWVTKFVDALLKDFVAGHIPQAELQQVLDSLPLGDNEKGIIMQLATYSAAQHIGKPHHLPAGEMVFAFENGLIDLGELTTFYESLGYTDDMVSIATQVALLKTKKLEDAAKAKAARQAAAAAKAAAKANPPATPATPASGAASS